VAGERADLIKSTGVPGLGDDLGAGEHRIGLDLPQDRRLLEQLAAGIARHHGRQIEAEAVHMHQPHPVAQTVEDEAPHHRVVGVEGVAAAAVVGVAGAVVRQERVVAAGLQAAERQRRSVLVPLGAVVEHDIEDDLDAGPVQGLDQIAELAHRGQHIGRAGIAAVRREERDGTVAPVVLPLGRRVLYVEMLHRQELHRGDAQIFQVGNLLDEPEVGPAPLGRDARARVAGEAADVHLVKDRAGKRSLQRNVAFPVVAVRIHYHAAHRQRAVVPRINGRLAVVGGAGDGARVRVEQDLVAVKAQALLGPHRSVGAEGIDLSRRQALYVDVPVIEGAVLLGMELDDLGRSGGVFAVEQQQLDIGAVLGEDAEVDPIGTHRGPQRVGQAGADSIAHKTKVPEPTRPLQE
jgi:hypothetical protein